MEPHTIVVSITILWGRIKEAQLHWFMIHTHTDTDTHTHTHVGKQAHRHVPGLPGLMMM